MFSLDRDRCEDLLMRIQGHCTQRGITLAAAESCTGGMISALLTERSGSSAFFHGGVVAYDNTVKREILQVPEAELARFGAVSAEVALSMARGVCQLLRTDLGLAVTGVAGPAGGSPEKPVGTVFCAWVTPTRSQVTRLSLKGDRAAVRAQTCLESLEGLLQFSIFDYSKGSGD